MGSKLSGGATKAVLEYMSKHDEDFTVADIRREYPNTNKNSIHSAFVTLESRGVLNRKDKRNGRLVWGKMATTPLDEALYKFVGINISRLKACMGLANPVSRFNSWGRD